MGAVIDLRAKFGNGKRHRRLITRFSIASSFRILWKEVETMPQRSGKVECQASRKDKRGLFAEDVA